MNEYKLRRDSLISPWGVGAIAPFPHDESLMIAGLDHWFDEATDKNAFEIIDQRLSERMMGKHFYLPPDYRERNRDNNGIKIPAVRFPLWNYCPVCGNMEKLTEGSQLKKCKGDMRRRGSRQSYCNKNIATPKRLRYLIPERFVAVCEKGHIEDFPIAEWVHQDGHIYNPATCKINRSTGGGSASLTGIRYSCTCGASRSMTGAFAKGALDRIGYFCSGNHPWLPGDNDPCGRSLLVMQRGASNVWFPEIVSSIYIPSDEDVLDVATLDIVNKVVSQVSSHKTDGEIDEEIIRRDISTLNQFIHHGIADEKAAFERIVEKLKPEADDVQKDEEYYRNEEYSVLIHNTGTPKDDLYVKNYPASDYANLSYIKSVSLVHKLKETRVFTGFRRISSEYDLVTDISSDSADWLPAVQNSGEGIMIQFDYEVLSKWSRNDGVMKRVQKMNKGDSDSVTLNPVFVLLHTFAHCLITALSNDSGYSSASIREKIYCSRYLENDLRMAGILIYTASGDAEGSLGGLVRQGAPSRLESIMFRAINEATWCASDPVCIQSEGQGQDGCNLAACHNCALLPETSCEWRNRTLDRGVMIGTLEDSSLGFFSDYVVNSVNFR